MQKIQIKIGSRGSDLALWQANHIKSELEKLGAEVFIEIFKTQGDKIQHLSLDKLEGKGFFTKELEDALLNGSIDLAVHSHKDLPTTSPEGLIIAAVSDREDPSELIIIRKECLDKNEYFEFKKNAIIGTSSARRKVQMTSFRPDIILKDIRGNVPTRIQKLREGQFDAILLAKAGVHRLKLDLSDLHVFEVSPRELIPAPAQGVLALQIRESDKQLFSFLQPLNNLKVASEIAIERKVLNLFDGGCHLPLGVYCISENNEFKIWASKAIDDTSLPQRLYMHTIKQDIAASIVASLSIPILKGKRIFISSEKTKYSYLKRILNYHEAILIDESMIEISGLEMKDKDFSSIDSVFFSSKNAVQHFFEQKPKLNANVFIGAFGLATEKALNEWNLKANYVGKHSDSEIIAEEFRNAIVGDRILFPQAADSLKIIENNLKPYFKVIELPIYQTKAKPNIQPIEADTYVFTSPSNVNAYLSEHKINSNASIIAIGKSTAYALTNQKIKVNFIADQPDEITLVDLIFTANL